MGLLSFLFGHHDPNAPPGQPGQPPLAPPTPFGYDPQGYLSPQQPQGAPGALLQHVAANSPTSALTAPPQPPQAPMGSPQGQAPQAMPQQGMPQQGQPITVTGQAPPPDTWKPHKAGILGQISDYILNTHFGKENVRRNEVEALQNIDKDPMQAVHRLMQVDPAAGEALYEKVTDQKRQQGNLDRQNKVYDLTVDRMLDGDVANMMYAAMRSSNPAAAYQAARNRAIDYGSRYGKDYSTIPEQYDPTDAQTYAMGGIPAAKQMVQQETHQKNQDTKEYRKQVLKERTNFHAGELAQGRTRLNIAQTNSDTMGQNADTAAMNADTNRMKTVDTMNRMGVHTLRSKGHPGYGQTVKGNPGQMIWYMPDGTKHLFLRGKDGNDWHYAHQMIGTNEKAKGVANPNEDDNANEN
jgi:hypothetical protein